MIDLNNIPLVSIGAIVTILGILTYYFGKLIGQKNPQRETPFLIYFRGAIFIGYFVILPIFFFGLFQSINLAMFYVLHLLILFFLTFLFYLTENPKEFLKIKNKFFYKCLDISKSRMGLLFFSTVSIFLLLLVYTITSNLLFFIGYMLNELLILTFIALIFGSSDKPCSVTVKIGSEIIHGDLIADTGDRLIFKVDEKEHFVNFSKVDYYIKNSTKNED